MRNFTASIKDFQPAAASNTGTSSAISFFCYTSNIVHTGSGNRSWLLVHEQHAKRCERKRLPGADEEGSLQHSSRHAAARRRSLAEPGSGRRAYVTFLPLRNIGRIFATLHERHAPRGACGNRTTGFLCWDALQVHCL